MDGRTDGRTDRFLAGWLLAAEDDDDDDDEEWVDGGGDRSWSHRPL